MLAKATPRGRQIPIPLWHAGSAPAATSAPYLDEYPTTPAVNNSCAHTPRLYKGDFLIFNLFLVCFFPSPNLIFDVVCLLLLPLDLFAVLEKKQ